MQEKLEGVLTDSRLDFILRKKYVQGVVNILRSSGRGYQVWQNFTVVPSGILTRTSQITVSGNFLAEKACKISKFSINCQKCAFCFRFSKNAKIDV